MLSYEELVKLSPPSGLSDEELEQWWKKQILEPDGSLIINDDWGTDELELSPA